MTDVKQLAIKRYTVSEAMLPPSFSTITGAAAAVGQMAQIKTLSHRSLPVEVVQRLAAMTLAAAKNVRIP